MSGKKYFHKRSMQRRLLCGGSSWLLRSSELRRGRSPPREGLTAFKHRVIMFKQGA